MAASQTARGRGKHQTISGDELRARMDGLGLADLAADKLGVSQDGRRMQMTGRRKAGRQIEIIIEAHEELQLPRRRKDQTEPPKGTPARRRRHLAQYLDPTPRRPERE
jgi:hypothetical protein